MIRCFIERGCFVAPCEFDTHAQLDRFLELGKQECDDKNVEMKELAEYHNVLDEHFTRYCFEYRENFERTEDEKRWDKLERLGEAPFSFDVTTIYPESVLEGAPSGFIDKRAQWAASKTENSSDVRTMRRLLHRAKQIREDFPKVNSDELSDIDQRNQFIYGCAQDEKLSWDDIAEKVKAKFKIVLNAKATAQAARDYRKKFTLPPVPERKRRGRPPGSTPKLDE